jgi:diphthamide biosynthesis protein 3
MGDIYDEIEIEDMAFNEEEQLYTYPCPCGDKFSIALEELLDGEEIASCPSCTLRIRVIYDMDVLEEKQKELEMGNEGVAVETS